MGYWKRVHSRAMTEAAKAARLESPERVVAALLTIVVPVFLFWVVMGSAGFDRASTVRIVGTLIAAPFAFAIFYGWHFIKAQNFLAEEAENRAKVSDNRLADYEVSKVQPIGARTKVEKN